MEPWYRVTNLRKEVREGRSFNPSEFAIHLEQVVAGTAPDDYKKPDLFFKRTCFTRALRDHVGMALRRLSGSTSNTAPVLLLVTQFGGGKTHTLTTLYHIANAGAKAGSFNGVGDLLGAAGLQQAPKAKIAVFVGNAWDPKEGRETPWIDVARQLAGDAGVKALGNKARTTPPGTESLQNVFRAADGPVLVLFDEVLNFLNRHRDMSEGFHAFIQNLTVAMTGMQNGAAVISLPRSQVEMTDWDIEWQAKITKVIKRVAKDLIANDEAEVGEVVRLRLFEDLGPERERKRVAKEFAEWCFERRDRLPPEWMAVDSASTESKAKEFLRAKFESCYPFHPATLSVFQRKWQTLPQYQQTRGTLAMLANWVSIAASDGFVKARTEPLITLGSAPLWDPNFRSNILGQLGEQRLAAAIASDIAGDHCHAKALDADTKGPLRDIHRRVGASILFESSGGQTEKLAHLPELRFALGEPGIDTTSIDTAALTLEGKAYYFKKIGTDGFKVSHQPTLKKVVNDRKASLDDEADIKPAMRDIVAQEFRRGANPPPVMFPVDGSDIPDTPRLTLVVAAPDVVWTGDDGQREHVAALLKSRGTTQRSYPAAVIWCARKPGKELREKVENWLAWRAVQKEVTQGTLGGEFDRSDRNELQVAVKDAEDAAREEVWGSYRFAVIAERSEAHSIRAIDLGAGHSSSGETLMGRAMGALKSEGLLNASVGANYLNRNWPPALKDSGEWPLSGLRKCFLDGSLTRLPDPDKILREKIAELVGSGDFALGAGRRSDGTFERVLFRQPTSEDEVDFDKDVFLLKPERATTAAAKVTKALFSDAPEKGSSSTGDTAGTSETSTAKPSAHVSMKEDTTCTIHLRGPVPPEAWNKIGRSIVPKLRSAGPVTLRVEFDAEVDAAQATILMAQLRQALDEVGLGNDISISKT